MSSLPFFEPFHKIPRLNRSMVVSEKIDGSNAAVIVEDETVDFVVTPDQDTSTSITVANNDGAYRVYAQSRKRIVTPGRSTDLQGFAAWVFENAPELVELLGPGRHFGEWYGQGIQRGYGLDHKRFALFNTDRWEAEFYVDGVPSVRMLGDAGIHAVPVLMRGPFSTSMINALVDRQRRRGSRVPGAHGFAAEGVVVWHNAARQMFKVTTENDERPKGSKEPA